MENEPCEQIWSRRFVNGVIVGKGEFLRCLFSDADALMRFSGKDEVSFEPCAFARIDAFAPEGEKFDSAWITFSETATERDRKTPSVHKSSGFGLGTI